MPTIILFKGYGYSRWHEECIKMHALIRVIRGRGRLVLLQSHKDVHMIMHTHSFLPAGLAW